MGGGQDTGQGRDTRPVALLCALGTLLAALFLCAAAGSGAAPGAGYGTAEAPGVQTAAAVHHPHSRAAMQAAYLCPYELPGCSPFSHLTPGVLTTPPPVAPLPALPVPAAGPARRPGPRLPAGPPARAPDLHVLQVLRT
ncbi:hypothetical protein [Streptomyces sp. NPDC089919]|uniref:hypothetical protein n=1 Tax=Streptomyces sp. NPDC089919 TaxID=3155188 RepID=UPI003434F269